MDMNTLCRDFCQNLNPFHWKAYTLVSGQDVRDPDGIRLTLSALDILYLMAWEHAWEKMGELYDEHCHKALATAGIDVPEAGAARRFLMERDKLLAYEEYGYDGISVFDEMADDFLPSVQFQLSVKKIDDKDVSHSIEYAFVKVFKDNRIDEEILGSTKFVYKEKENNIDFWKRAFILVSEHFFDMYVLGGQEHRDVEYLCHVEAKMLNPFQTNGFVACEGEDIRTLEGFTYHVTENDAPEIMPAGVSSLHCHLRVEKGERVLVVWKNEDSEEPFLVHRTAAPQTMQYGEWAACLKDVEEKVGDALHMMRMPQRM